MLADLGRPVVGRLVALAPVLFGITLLVFVLNAIALGDPGRTEMGQRVDPDALERLRHEYALDRPLPVQYALWIGRLIRGDLGMSFREQRPVVEVLAERAAATIRLAPAATGVSIVPGKHALRNALIPVVTVIGIGLADLLVGAPLTETVFAWPGLGRLLVAAVGQRDLPVVMGAVLVFALIYVLGNLLVDVAYLVIDPRLRDGRAS